MKTRTLAEGGYCEEEPRNARRGGLVIMGNTFWPPAPKPLSVSGEFYILLSLGERITLRFSSWKCQEHIVQPPLQLRCRSYQWAMPSWDFVLWGCDNKQQGLWSRWEQGILVGAGTSGDDWMLLCDRGNIWGWRCCMIQTFWLAGWVWSGPYGQLW